MASNTTTPAIALCGEPAHQLLADIIERDDGQFQLGIIDDASGPFPTRRLPARSRHMGLPIEKSEAPEIKHSQTLASPGNKDRVMQRTEENCEPSVVIATGLLCPQCDRAIRHYDFELITGSAFRIVCQGCHQTVIQCEGQPK
jgi:hypothetical protein